MEFSDVSIRMESDLKDQFSALCSELGLDVSTAVTIFAKAAVRQNGIPFSLTLDTPNAETLRVFAETERGENLSRRFSTVDELWEDLNA